MSDCKICFHKGDGKMMRKAGVCPVCHPNDPPIDPAEDACVCPPLGEPNRASDTII